MGVVDGMMISMQRPNNDIVAEAGIDSQKTYCTRKKRFGLNLQATCDHKRRFTNISIKYPASVSDFVAFDSSKFRINISKNGFLAPGLCLFGDNAYVNEKFMATNFPNVPVDDPKRSL